MPSPLKDRPPEAQNPSWVMLAVFTQPHGVSGRIKVKSFTEPMDDFANHANLTDEAGNPIKLQVTGHTQGTPVVSVEGVTKREQAELLRGKKIGVKRAEMPKLENPNLYYTDDLIGMAVVEADDAPFGEVVSIANYGAGDILDIRRTTGERELYAFTHRTFPTVDMETRKIQIHPPEILRATGEDN